MDHLLSKFDLETVRKIKEDIDEIQKIAIVNYHDNAKFLNIIDHLARVGGMFADVLEQQLEEGHVQTGDPQDYIVGKLSTAHLGMKRYETGLQSKSSV
jgi:hypothetical protein